MTSNLPRPRPLHGLLVTVLVPVWYFLLACPSLVHFHFWLPLDLCFPSSRVSLTWVPWAVILARSLACSPADPDFYRLFGYGVPVDFRNAFHKS